MLSLTGLYKHCIFNSRERSESHSLIAHEIRARPGALISMQAFHANFVWHGSFLSEQFANRRQYVHQKI